MFQIPNTLCIHTFRIWLALLTFGCLAASPIQAHSPNTAIEAVISTAESYLGTPHRLGGTSRSGIDCSGLMYVSFLSVDYTLPRVSRDQARVGVAVGRKSLQRGDLVFFAKGGRIFHVGLVLETRGGDAMFIHTSSSRGVMKSRLSQSYWKSHYHSARRVWPESRPTPATPIAAQTDPVSHISILDTSATRKLPGRFPKASQRLLTKRELKGLSSKKLRIMRNEIFARYGYTFSSRDLRKYFGRQSWYRKLLKTRSQQVVNDRLTEIEKMNIALIRKMER